MGWGITFATFRKSNDSVLRWSVGIISSLALRSTRVWLTISQISFALQRANQPALACIKISILLFYLRIFGQNNRFRLAAYINMAYTLGWAISTWIVNLTVCTPIAYYYDRTIKGGSCKNQAISGSVNGGLSLLGDISILVLPLPMMWHLKMNTRRKIGISGIFMLGCLYVFLLTPIDRH